MATDTMEIRPQEVDGIDVVFGSGSRELAKLLPRSEDIPAEFHEWHGNAWVDLVSKWFFEGLDTKPLKAKPGIDKNKALRHVGAIMKSWEPKHEHKIAGCAYLMSLWFEPVR